MAETEGPTGEIPTEEAPPHPWGFWLIVTLAVLYLGWRLVQGLVWLVQWVFG